MTAKLHDVMSRDVTISHRIILKVMYQAEAQAKICDFKVHTV